jgi:hypothetical protein
LIRAGIVTILGLVLTGCGLLEGNSGLFGQGVAFPQPADSPPTSEAALPQPVVLASDTPALTEEPVETAAPTPTLTATAPAAAVPQPPQPPPTASLPAIHSFSADVTNTNQGKRITFTWESSGAAAARIYNWANGSTRFPAFWDVPPDGTLTVNLTGTRRSNPDFELFVYAPEGDTIFDSRTLEIPWPCSLAYFFDPEPEICPWTEPTYTTAASQQFQGGRMIWLETLDWIYVLYDEVYPDSGHGGDLQWERYDDDWHAEGARLDLDSPPPGFYVPAGRFALGWQENPMIRERLGWATAPETVFEGAWQLQPSDTDYQGDGAIFILLEDGRVAHLSGFDIWGWLWAAFDPLCALCLSAPLR